MRTYRLFLCMLLCSATAASAGVHRNGKDLNGKDLNGKDLNGKDLNGKDLNGTSFTGLSVVNGTTIAGYVGGVYKTGTQLLGARISVNNDSASVVLKVESMAALPSPNSDVQGYVISAEYWMSGCNHYGYVEGVRLNKLCSNVEGAVIERDPYCGSTRWDAECVRKFWEEYDKAIASGAGWKYYSYRHTEASICGQDGDEDGYWRSSRPLRKGTFIAGRWDAREGIKGAGGRASTSGVTFACLPSPNGLGGGAIAKCVRNGYKPWKSDSMRYFHEGCVRMYRADFCGDGVSWTDNGHAIDIADKVKNDDGSYSSLQTRETTWLPEAYWFVKYSDPQGAKAVYDIARTRKSTSSATKGMTLEQYVDYRQKQDTTWCAFSYGSSTGVWTKNGETPAASVTWLVDYYE